MTEYISAWKWTKAEAPEHNVASGISAKGMQWHQHNSPELSKDLEPILKRMFRYLGFYPDLLACPACGSTKVKPEDPTNKLHQTTQWICKPCNKPNTIARFTIAIQSHLAKCYRCGGKGFMQFQRKKICPACNGRGWLRM